MLTFLYMLFNTADNLIQVNNVSHYNVNRILWENQCTSPESWTLPAGGAVHFPSLGLPTMSILVPRVQASRFRALRHYR